jgi:hypothetical protein
MNNRGELELAINKRLLERAVFILIILALGIFLFYQRADVPDQSEEVSLLTKQVNDKNAQLEQLAQQLHVAQEKAAEPAPVVNKTNSTPAVITPVVPAQPALSGKLTYDWEVIGEVQTPDQYNAATLTPLRAELAELEDELEDADSDDRPAIKDEIDEVEDDISALLDGEPKFKLQAVTITIDNGFDTSEVVDYELCWPQIDCLHVKSAGALNVPAAQTYTQSVPITIPSLITIDKSKQVLRLTLKQDNKEVFKEDYTITP